MGTEKDTKKNLMLASILVNLGLLGYFSSLQIFSWTVLLRPFPFLARRFPFVP